MATFKITGSANGSITGTGGNDIYVVNPDDLGFTMVRDLGGFDRLRLIDTPGRDSGEFFATKGDLVWRNFEGDTIRFDGGATGPGRLERVEWQSAPGDQFYRQELRVVMDPASLSVANSIVALTQGNDVIGSTLSTAQGGWSEVYGNGGDDRMTASDKHLFILLGGRGRDVLLGQGDFDDTFQGDQDDDVLRGYGGDDRLGGGSGADLISGGRGADAITGDFGADVMRGGTGADEFLFFANNGRDRIEDFNADRDTLVFFDLEFEDLTLTQVGDDAHISYGESNRIVVLDTLRQEIGIRTEEL